MAHIKTRRLKRGGVKYDVCWGNQSRSYTDRTVALLAQIAVERGDDPPPTRIPLPDSTTFGEFWGTWEARWQIGKSVKTIEAKDSAWNHLRALADVRLSRLSAAQVEDLIAEVAGCAPVAAEKALSHIKRCLKSAEGREHKIDPRILTLEPPSYTKPPPRFLTWDEVLAIARELDPRVCRIVPFAALTGMRKGELFGLTDSRVNLADGFVTLGANTKTSKPRTVWLSAHALELLREQIMVRTPNERGLVFPTEAGTRLRSRFNKSYRDAVKYVGLGAILDHTGRVVEKGATFHSLRHTCASLMIKAGCNPLEIAEQLGHERKGKPDATMIWQVYGHLYPGATREAVRRLDVLIREDTAEEATG